VHILIIIMIIVVITPYTIVFGYMKYILCFLWLFFECILLIPRVRRNRIPKWRLLVKQSRKNTNEQGNQPFHARVLIPDHAINNDGPNFTHRSDHGKTCRRDQPSQQKLRVRHQNPRGARRAQGENRSRRPLKVAQNLVFSRYHAQQKHRNHRQQVRVVTSPPGGQFNVIHRELNVHLIKREHDEPRRHPRVRLHFKVRIRKHVRDRAHQDRRERQPTSRVR